MTANTLPACHLVVRQSLTLRTDFVNNKEGWPLTLSRYSDAGGLTLVAKTEYGCDTVGNVTRIVSKDAGNTILNQIDYALDSADRVTQVRTAPSRRQLLATTTTASSRPTARPDTPTTAVSTAPAAPAVSAAAAYLEIRLE